MTKKWLKGQLQKTLKLLSVKPTDDLETKNQFIHTKNGNKIENLKIKIHFFILFTNNFQKLVIPVKK